MTVNQPFPGTVGAQMDSCPAGGSGENQTVVLPSALVWTAPLWLLTLGNAVLGVCSRDRVWGS